MQAPSAPANLVVTLRTTTSIALSWAASTDNVGVTGYGLYRAGTLVGTSTQTAAVFSGLTCNTSHTLSVDAYDAAGNRSSKTNTLVSTTACPDTTPPSAPSGLNVSNASQTSLTLGWNESTDNVGAVGYDVYRAGTKVGTTQGTSYTFGNLTCGTSHVLGVAAYDAAGNRSATVTATGSTSACSAPTPGFPSSFYTGPAGQGILLPSQQGTFLGTAQSPYNGASPEQQMADLESYVGRRIDIEHRFMQSPNACTPLDAGLIDAIARRGHIPMISWNPNLYGDEILAGKGDECLRQFGAQIAAQPHKLILRPYSEFNGNWRKFSKYADGTMLTSAEFKALWIRSIGKLREGGAFPKASIYWCGSEGYYTRPVWINALDAYPGDQYVDWVGNDGYGYDSRQFSQIGGITKVEQDFRGRKPVMVGETSARERSDDTTWKGNWWRGLRDHAKASMPGLLGVIVFDVAYSDGDWRIGTSDNSRQGFRDLARDPHFNTR
jgi:chitodextrinase